MVDAGFEVAEPLVDDDDLAGAELVMAPSGEEDLVLVVDDDDDVRRLLVKVLKEKGFRVVEASDGAAALTAVRDYSFSVIVLDAMLPKVHGFEIARRLKASEVYQHIPVVMVSAEYRGWRFAEDAKTNYGVHAYVEKPFKVTDVLNAVAGALAQSSSRPEPKVMSQRAAEHLEQGLVHYRAGRIEDASQELLTGLGVDPLAYQLHFQLGLVYAKGDRLFDAIQALENSLDIQPGFFPALKNVAVLYQNAGFKNKAIEMWERCLVAAPDDSTRASIREHLVAVF